MSTLRVADVRFCIRIYGSGGMNRMPSDGLFANFVTVSDWDTENSFCPPRSFVFQRMGFLGNCPLGGHSGVIAGTEHS